MGVLSKYTVLELAGIGPGPMAGMMMADMGARVIRIERPLDSNTDHAKDPSFRGKESVILDLKQPQAIATLLRMISQVDVLIDPYRPGVCERLGIGPVPCMEMNSALVYGRITGWGQDGPLSQSAGHDIGYISITGALHSIGRKDQPPTVPLNLIGDMGGGGMLLLSGILGALLETHHSGVGQVVDAAMVDGTIQQLWMAQGMLANGQWDDGNRASNMLDGGAPYYSVYQCADGKYVSVGAIEDKFYRVLLQQLGMDSQNLPDREDQAQWEKLYDLFARKFLQQTQQYWCELFDGIDACVSPIISLSEAPEFPANKQRNCFIEVDGFLQTAPAPRFSRTPSKVQSGSHKLGSDTPAVLTSMGFTQDEIESLADAGVVPPTNSSGNESR